jgi:multiple sugar transport system permease protein
MASSETSVPTGRDPEAVKRTLRWFSYAALFVLTAIYVAPFIWMVLTSFKTNFESTRVPPTWFPEQFTTQSYDTLSRPASQTPVFRWFLNSMVAAGGHTLLVLITASTAAYPLARMDFRGKRILFGLIIATLFMPPIIFLVPNYLIVDGLGWLDTLLAVSIPGAAGAFGVFFMRQFFVSLPGELEEAALLDGANHFQIFTRVILPLSKPALATLAILSFLTNWNDFLWPLSVLIDAQNLTLPPGLTRLQGAYVTDYSVIMAGAVIASIPVVLIFILAQRYIVEGVARTGLKG